MTIWLKIISLARPAGGWARFFRVCIATGCCLLAVEPVIEHHNAKINTIRRDAASTAYFMRGDVESIFNPGGTYLIIAGVFGVAALGRKTGSWRQGKFAVFALPPLLTFWLGNLTKGLYATAFAGIIYDTSAIRDPMDLTEYRQVTSLIHLSSLGAGLAVMWAVARRYRVADRSAPRCEECGYNVKGNMSGVCPECGTNLPRLANDSERSPALSSKR